MNANNSKSQQPNLQVGILDSGVGGLSVLSENIQRYPKGVDWFYLADHQYFPYGEKSGDQITKHLLQLCIKFCDQFKLEGLILACNSASTHALEQIRAAIKIPVIGVVPAIKPAAKLTKTGHLALLATPLTVNSNYTNQLIKDFANQIQMHRFSPGHLVHLCERNIIGHTQCMDDFLDILKPIWEIQEIDVVVLACTHFPLVKDIFTALSNKHQRPITYIDSGSAIAARVGQIFKVSNHKHSTIYLMSTAKHGVDILHHLDPANPAIQKIQPWVSKAPNLFL